MKQKHRYIVKCIVTFVLAICIVLGSIPVLPEVTDVKAETIYPIIDTPELGIGKIGNPKAPESADDPWTGSYVYYGKYSAFEDNTPLPIKFRVLQNDTTDFSKEVEQGKAHTMFLDSDRILDNVTYASTFNDWSESLAKRRLNTDFSEKAFTIAENNCIAESYVTSHERHIEEVAEGEQRYIKNIYGPYVVIEGEKIFWLDLEDIFNPLYGYYTDKGNNKKKNYTNEFNGYTAYWWLRSECSNQLLCYSGTINIEGDTEVCDVSYIRGDSPALNLNLSSIVFSYLIKKDENSSEAGEYGAEYKLTVIDGGMSIAKTGAEIILGNDISVPYKIAIDKSLTSSSPNCVSIVVTDGTWTENGWSEGAKILQYEKVADITSNDSQITGTVNFTLDNNITGTLGKDYQIYLLAEDVNGVYETDYTTVPVDITSTASIFSEDFVDASLMLGTVLIKQPKAPESSNDAWTGSYVYYGKYNGKPVKYRVLDNNTTKFSIGATEVEKAHSMFLDCDSILFKDIFREDENASNASIWSESDLITVLNDTENENSFINTSFTDVEEAAIMGSNIDAHPLTKDSSEAGAVNVWYETQSLYGNYVALTGEKIFLIDAEDASNNAYGYETYGGPSETRTKKDLSDNTSAGWWLRSSSTSGKYGGSVFPEGDLMVGSVSYGRGVCPAFNVNLSSVIFSSLIKDDENSPQAGEYGAEYKLTVVDRGMNIAKTDEAIASGNVISIPYKVDSSHTRYSPDRVSVVVTHGAWTENGWSEGTKFLQYEEVATIISNDTEIIGTANFTLDSRIIGVLGGDYHIYILAEDINGAYETDYATEPFEITDISGSKVKLGDVNGNGDVNMKDVAILRRYLTGGWNITIDMEAADVDGDGIVSPKDVTVLKRYFAGGWGIEF
ncbi:MAG: dockerin type I repeat-containing protein [Lachnospiraceae bacterium]|nr:dockerin type I repeat-containing protein [Lachnospiraceae bacterium]